MHWNRLLYTLSLLTLCSWQAAAEDPYFCTTADRVLYYERYLAGSDSLLQNTTISVGAVDSSDTGRRVHYGFEMKKADGRAMLGGRTELVARILPDGLVMTDLYKGVQHFLRKLAPHVSVTSVGDPGIYPARMQPGDTLPDSHSIIKVFLLKYRMSYTERRVLRQERLTTPAGTYDCVVIREHRKERGLLNKVDLWLDSWYARGVGAVRHDYYNKRMKLEESEILISNEQAPLTAPLLPKTADQVRGN